MTEQKQVQSKTTMILISFFLGGLGIHRLMMGYSNWWLMLITLGGCGIWALIDFVKIVTGSYENSEDFEVSEFNSILSALEKTYGNDWHKTKYKDRILNGAIWDGEKVRLELIRFGSGKSKTNQHDYDFVSGYIAVYDKKLQREMYSSDF